MAGPGLVFITYPKAITQMTLTPLLLHFFYGRSWSCFHHLSKGYHTDAVTTITITLILWQVPASFSSPIHYCCSSFMAFPGLVFIAYPKAITQMPLPPLLLHFFYGRSWPCCHRLSKGFYTDAVTTITITLILWQVPASFSSPIHYCCSSFMAFPGLVFIAYPKAITQMPLPPLL